MAVLPKLPPSSLRPDASLGSASAKTRSPEPRPYLIAGTFRRTDTVNRRPFRAELSLCFLTNQRMLV